MTKATDPTLQGEVKARSPSSRAGPALRRDVRPIRVASILQHSVDVLANNGCIGYSVSRVASEADIRLSTLQHYFPNRELLLAETVRTVSESWLAKLTSIARDPALVVSARLDAFVDDFFSAFNSPSMSAFVFEVLTLSESEPFAARIVRDSQQRLTQLIATMVAETNNSLSPAACWLRATLISAQTGGLLIFCRLGDRTGTDVMDLRQATKALWNALCHAPG